jgi:hypothetical protein
MTMFLFCCASILRLRGYLPQARAGSIGFVIFLKTNPESKRISCSPAVGYSVSSGSPARRDRVCSKTSVDAGVVPLFSGLGPWCVILWPKPLSGFIRAAGHHVVGPRPSLPYLCLYPSLSRVLRREHWQQSRIT